MITEKRADNIILLVVITYFATTYFITSYARAKWIVIGCALTVVMIAFLMNRGRLRMRLGMFHLLSASFLVYCWMSALWAADPGLTMERVITVFQSLGAVYLIYIYYQNKPVKNLLLAAMLGGYAVCVVVIMDQGLDVYLAGIISARRVYNRQYMNANTLGMVAASSIVLNFYHILYEKKVKWWTVLAAPAMICLLGGGSKKAIILLVAGCFLLIVLRSYSDKKKLRSMARMVFFVVVFIAAMVILSRFSAFDLLSNRMESLINFVKGSGEVDGSTRERAAMIQVGLRLFRSSPVWGFGMNNPQLYNFGRAYLHNNYVELLAGGGIIGFTLYYSMYAYLLYNMYKYRAYRTKEYDICLTLILLDVILEYGHVAYYNKETYFYFMIYFAEVIRLKRAARGQAMQGYGGIEERGVIRA